MALSQYLSIMPRADSWEHLFAPAFSLALSQYLSIVRVQTLGTSAFAPALSLVFF